MRYLLLLLPLTLLFSCSKSEEKQREKDEELILDYIADNNLTAEEGPEGLFYIIDQPGTGAQPTLSNTVVVHYEGFLLDGFKFDSSYDRNQAAEFPLLGVIRGWQLGIPLFREGGSGTLLIPSHLAYGGSPPPGSGIQKDAVLRFEIELLEVK